MNDFLTKRWPVLLALGIVIYGLVLATFSHEGFPVSMDYGHGMPYLSDRPVGEDAYYMLTVAWNLAREGRIVYNLNKPTTGIQPLATLLYAGISYVVQFLGGDRWFLVRSTIVVNVLLMLVLARQIGFIARALVVDREAQRLAYALGVVTTLSSMWVFRAFTYGLETGIYLVLIASTVLLTLRHDRPINPVKLGLLAGFTGLARIDFGLIFGLHLLWLIKDRRVRLRGAIGAGLVALLITLPWFLWIHAQTGNWLPSSATAQSGWINLSDATLRFKGMSAALLWNLTPWISSWDLDMRFVWASAALAALFWGMTLPAVHASLKEAGDVPNRWALRQFAAWSVCIAALVPVYLSACWAWHFYGRYTAPLLVLAIPAVAVVATLAGGRPSTPLKSRSVNVKESLGDVRPEEFFQLPSAIGHSGFVFQHALKWLPVAMLALTPGFFVVLAGLQLHSGHMILDLPINAGFVHDQVDSKLLVGAAQSGTVGFFNQNVVNLDGKIDPKAQYSMRHGGIRTYIDSQRIDVLVDWPAVYRAFLFAGYTGDGWQLCDRQPHGKSRCYERNPRRPTN